MENEWKMDGSGAKTTRRFERMLTWSMALSSKTREGLPGGRSSTPFKATWPSHSHSIVFPQKYTPDAGHDPVSCKRHKDPSTSSPDQLYSAGRGLCELWTSSFSMSQGTSPRLAASSKGDRLSQWLCGTTPVIHLKREKASLALRRSQHAFKLLMTRQLTHTCCYCFGILGPQLELEHGRG